MATGARGGREALQWLVRSSHLSRADDLPTLARDAAGRLGATRTALYVVDYEQTVLAEIRAAGDEAAASTLSIDATLAGRAFRDVAVQVGASEGGATLWVPVVDGAERLGVLEVAFPADVAIDQHLILVCRDVAGLLAELMMTRSRYGDSVERARRRTPLSLPAELQWQLLPPLTFVAPRVAVAGILAPATEVAGDSFDYSVDGDRASVAIIDAMGHGLEATLLSAVAISALRNARRRGLELAALVPELDRALADAFGGDRFVTGIFGELDTTTGVWRWATCGHPPALLVRQGRVVKVLDAVVDPPLGLELLGAVVELGEERLEPGDRLLLYTDGVIEARDAAGAFFGTRAWSSSWPRAGRPTGRRPSRCGASTTRSSPTRRGRSRTTPRPSWSSGSPRSRSAPSRSGGVARCRRGATWWSPGGHRAFSPPSYVRPRRCAGPTGGAWWIDRRRTEEAPSASPTRAAACGCCGSARCSRRRSSPAGRRGSTRWAGCSTTPGS